MTFSELYKRHYVQLTSAPITGETGDASAEVLSKYIKMSNATTMVEIGFNRGSSSLTALLSLDTVVVHSIDLRSHEEVKNSVDYLTRTFPNRFFYYQASSAQLLDLIKFPVDLIFIDGDHSYEAVLRDTQLSLRLNPKYIMYDDVCHHAHTADINAVIQHHWPDLDNVLIDCNTYNNGMSRGTGLALVNLTNQRNL
jgi:predicted O-methyltransferase YrrM